MTASRRRRRTVPAAAALCAVLSAACAAPVGGRVDGPSAGVNPEYASMLPDPVLTARLIRIGADATTPPHLFVNADGKVDGLEFDFMKALGQELGMSVGVVSTSFSGLAPSLLSGRIDAAMSDFSDTIEQVDFVAYSRTADVSSSAGEIRTTSDLCGLKVSATQ